MVISTDIAPQPNSDLVYQQAIVRLEKDLGWSPRQAHEALARLAAAYGVFLDDVAAAVLAARSIKRGLRYALRYMTFDRRPPV